MAIEARCAFDSGSAKLMTGPGDHGKLLKKIEPGMTVRVKPGQWLVEKQGEVHHAANAGEVPIVIYIATLLRTGEPVVDFKGRKPRSAPGAGSSAEN